MKRAALPQTPPNPLCRWKSNVRHRHAERIPLRKRCDRCGIEAKLSRHHEWEGHQPGNPPPVAAQLCKRCHAIADGGLKDAICDECGQPYVGAKRHKRRCKVRRERVECEKQQWIAQQIGGSNVELQDHAP